MYFPEDCCPFVGASFSALTTTSKTPAPVLRPLYSRAHCRGPEQHFKCTSSRHPMSMRQLRRESADGAAFLHAKPMLVSILQHGVCPGAYLAVASSSPSRRGRR